SYLASKPPDPGGENPVLNALLLEAELLRQYLDNANISHVKIMFAHSRSYIDSGHTGRDAGLRSDALTVIIAGYDSMGNYLYAPGGMVLNHATPCPRNCPATGTASSNLFE